MRPCLPALLSILFGLLSLPPASAQTALDVRDLMQSANTAYESGDFDTAIDLYEIVLQEGAAHPAVHFNLASVYLQSGDLARALLHYHRAYRRAPRDVEIRVHLERARLQAPTTGAQWADFPLNMANISESLATRDELAISALALWSLWCAGLLGLLLNPAARDRWRVPVVALTVPLLIALALLGARLYADEAQPLVIVMADGGAMSGPDAEFVPLFELSEAAEARLLETRGEWGRLLLPGGRQGWLPLNLLQKV